MPSDTRPGQSMAGATPPTLTPVSAERHGALRWRRFSSYAFVQDHPLVPIVLGEEMQVAASLPILFQRIDSRVQPVALTRIGARTALVAPNGAWRGSYVPAILRVHPFSARATEAGQFALLIDESSGLLSDDPADPAFFDEAGQIAPELAQVVDFFRSHAQAGTKTGAAMMRVARTDLLEPFTPPEGSTLPEGLLHVAPAALTALGRTELSDLHRTGALELIYAACVARHHLAFLAAAEAQLATARTQTPPQPVPSGAEAALGGFLDTFAAARTQETGLADFLRSSGTTDETPSDTDAEDVPSDARPPRRLS